MRIRKGVIPAAGWGTRFLPATKALPKEMLPLVDRPVIQYIVEEAVASGITELVIVTALGKRALEEHFHRSFALEQALEKRGEGRLLREVRQLSELADISYVRQREQLGLGHAILLTQALIGEEPFCVFLPDDIIEAEVPAMAQMLRVYERYQGCVVAVKRVAREAVSSYGIVEPFHGRVEDRVYRVLSLVEKPQPQEALSDLGIVGRYVLCPEIFEALKATPPGRGGEIQLTDALALLLQRQAVYAYEFEGVRHDAGTPLGFLKASVELALRHPEMGEAFRQYLRGLDLGADLP